jgi:transcription elongation factor Elf1
MPKTKTFRVISGRMHFVCFSCGNKRMISVAPSARRQSVHCQKCGELTRCVLNRRVEPREAQSGKVLLYLADGRPLEVDLFDISRNGVGFDVSPRDAAKLVPGRDVQLRCPWNPNLFGNGRYVIRTINGRRVGVFRKG